MDRIFLEVPFTEKDEAKSLGARWDPDIRKWFIPAGKPLEPFSRWVQMNGERRKGVD